MLWLWKTKDKNGLARWLCVWNHLPQRQVIWILFSGILGVKGENWCPQVDLWPLQGCHGTHTYHIPALHKCTCHTYHKHIAHMYTHAQTEYIHTSHACITHPSITLHSHTPTHDTWDTHAHTCKNSYHTRAHTPYTYIRHTCTHHIHHIHIWHTRAYHTYTHRHTFTILQI